MQKLFISADIEGTCGITDWAEADIANPQGIYARNEMTKEVSSACEGALKHGVKEILVRDAHGSARSITPSELPEQVNIFRSWAREPYSMMSGLDRTYEGVFFIGYHSAAGTDGNPLSHTMNTHIVQLSINNTIASEFMINSYTAAMFGVPVLLLTGDEALCKTASSINPNIVTVPVSVGCGGGAISINPSLAQKQIKRAAYEALDKDPSKLIIDMPDKFNVSISYRNHFDAKKASFYPGATRTGNYEVSYSSQSWMDVITFMFFVL